jgi:hypothetical protein
MMRLFGLWLPFLLFFPAISLHAQDTTLLRKKTEARQLMADREFDQALPLFRDLVVRYPKEPEYLYSTGVCLVKMNTETENAIVLLRQASVTGFNPLSWYYLGLALHRSYQFDDAIRAYSKFILQGKAADVHALEAERLVEMARNGLEYTQTGRKFSVTDINDISTENLEHATDINGSGKLVKKPVEFCSKTDLREGFRPLMFLPSYTEMNDYVFVAGYEKGKKNRKQIYRVKNINHETWGLPEPLSFGINTPYDEEYPFFDTKNSTLYFSSKGHSSMGGFDIFKTTYDWNTKTWSKPENLGFPINSPYDDFFFTTDEFTQSGTFISNRNTGPGQATIYRIRIGQDTMVALHTVNDILRMANPKAEPVNRITTGKPAADLPMKTPSIVVIDSASQPMNDEYGRIISEALNFQLTSDSLGRFARDKRLVAKETADGEAKRQMIAEILRAEKESKRLQREADQKYALADRLKGRLPVILPDTVTEAPPLAADKDADLPKHADVFSIASVPQYSADNPIPSGLSTEPGLIYRIQLGAFTKPRPNDAFGGINPITREEAPSNQVHKYYAGLFYSLSNVTQALQRIRSNGFPDAFVVAFLDGRLITTEKAREMEFGSMKY